MAMAPLAHMRRSDALTHAAAAEISAENVTVNVISEMSSVAAALALHAPAGRLRDNELLYVHRLDRIGWSLAQLRAGHTLHVACVLATPAPRTRRHESTPAGHRPQKGKLLRSDTP